MNKLYSLLLLTISLFFFLFLFSCADHEHTSNEDNSHLHQHPFDGHTFSDVFKGEEQETIVCYKKTHRNSFYLTMFLLVGIAGVSFNMYRIKKKSSNALSISHKIIEEKNKDILDSINYAKRIQNSIMPSSSLPLGFEGFILYQPKDIVSGDFYWYKQEGDKLFIAAVDCTGHGVPGAFLSILGAQALQTAFTEDKENGTSMMLKKMNALVHHSLKGNIETELSDGMEVALCIFDRISGKLQFSGAGRPLIVISKGELSEYKSSKLTIGAASTTTSFHEQEIELKEGDSFFIYSDGYADQFGGERNKKYNVTRLKALLTSMALLPAIKQKELFSSTLKKWKGDFEQVDDILVIGIQKTSK
ncbi:MAG: SpoIIE family protein phosphatase [Bacteroidota bacterium]|nr:SpoIIE family protein phosphatase [Bacteroidota bacterium]